MIVNRYAKKCQSCEKNVPVGKGFAYKNGNAWFTTCASKACHRKLGLKAPNPEEEIKRELTEDGYILMPFDRTALPLLRSMPGAIFVEKYPHDPEKKCWKVSIEPADLPRVIEVCQQLELEIPDLLIEQASEGTKESREALQRAERLRTDGKGLFPFQKKGVEFLALHDRALLADDMGLGKTVQVLVALPSDQRVIIICPAAVKYNWRKEIELWRPDYNVSICSGRGNLKLPGKGEITITNYEILPSYLLPNDNKEVDLTNEQKKVISECTVICDEVHLCKNYKTSRAKKVTQLSRNARRVWFLTGTPLMNRPTDLYGVLCSGNMNVLGSWNKFLKLFNGYQNGYGGYEFGMPEPEVPERMKRVMLRRLKIEVLKELPTKTYKDIEVNIIDKEFKKTLDKIADEVIVDGDLITHNLPNFTEFSKIRAKLAESRIPAMLEIAETYEESETPLVIFSAHKKPILTLGEREGWEIITGDTSTEERFRIVEDFQAGKLKGVGLTISAGGVGLTLTYASNMLFVDLDWTPALNLQAQDRCHRISQKENVLIMRMFSSHPLDVHMHQLIALKTEIARKALEESLKFKPIKKRPKTQEIELIDETDEELAERIANAEVEAEREVALSRLEKVASRESIKVNDVPEPPLTPARKIMLRKALKYMADRCDGAFTRDGIGFSKPDAGIGHWLNATGLRDDDEMPFRVLERILVRYRRQLKGEYEAIWKPD